MEFLLLTASHMNNHLIGISRNPLSSRSIYMASEKIYCQSLIHFWLLFWFPAFFQRFYENFCTLFQMQFDYCRPECHRVGLPSAGPIRLLWSLWMRMATHLVSLMTLDLYGSSSCVADVFWVHMALATVFLFHWAVFSCRSGYYYSQWVWNN